MLNLPEPHSRPEVRSICFCSLASALIIITSAPLDPVYYRFSSLIPYFSDYAPKTPSTYIFTPPSTTNPSEQRSARRLPRRLRVDLRPRHACHHPAPAFAGPPRQNRLPRPLRHTLPPIPLRRQRLQAPLLPHRRVLRPKRDGVPRLRVACPAPQSSLQITLQPPPHHAIPPPLPLPVQRGRHLPQPGLLLRGLLV